MSTFAIAGSNTMSTQVIARVVFNKDSIDNKTMYESEDYDMCSQLPSSENQMVDDWNGYSVMPLEIKQGVVTAECAICQEPVKPGEMSATTICQTHRDADQHTHFFCRDDLKQWQRQCENNSHPFTCPVCRCNLKL